MSYESELDDLRREVRADASAIMAYWPKVNGRNVVVTAASASLFDKDGTSLGAISASVEVGKDDGGDPAETLYSRIDLTVPACDLGENYTIEVTFTSGGLPYVDAFTFDSVLYPIAHASMVSLNDLLEVRPDVADVLERQGLRLGFEAEEAAEKMASIYSVRAIEDIQSRLGDACREQRGSRPSLVIQRDRLSRPIRYTAMKLIYAAESSNPEDGEDEAAGIYRHFRAAADAAWRGVGPLQFRVPTSDSKTTVGEAAHDQRCVPWRRA